MENEFSNISEDASSEDKRPNNGKDRSLDSHVENGDWWQQDEDGGLSKKKEFSDLTDSIVDEMVGLLKVQTLSGTVSNDESSSVGESSSLTESSTEVESDIDESSLFERSTPVVKASSRPTRQSLVGGGRNIGVSGDIIHRNVPDHSFTMLATLLENFVRLRTKDLPPDVSHQLFETVHDKLFAGGIIPHLGPRIASETSTIRSRYLGAISSLLQDTVQERMAPGSSGRIVQNSRLRMLEPAKSETSVTTFKRPPPRVAMGKTASDIFLAGASRRMVTNEGVDLSGGYSSSFFEHEVLGTGASGTVYKAQHKVDKMWYALKKVKLSTTKDWKKQLNEVFTMAAFEHPNIARYFGCWIDNPRPGTPKQKDGQKQVDHKGPSFTTYTGPENYEEESNLTPTQNNKTVRKNYDLKSEDWRPLDGVYTAPSQQYVLCIAMSLYPDVLSSHLGEKGSHCFHEEAALPLFISVVDAVDHIHRAGFVHRDIKPANVFLQYSQNLTTCCGKPVAIPRIGDFGLVTDLAEGGEQSQPVGTRLYMPPEGESGRHKTTDIWALGITCFELFVKFDTKAERIVVLSELKKTGKLPESVKISPKIKKLIEGCLDLNHELRWTTALIRASVT